jgi:hypothetical protein
VRPLKKHTVYSNNSVLPETIAFIVSNSLEAFSSNLGGGVTNINNTINIYSTQTTNMLPESDLMGAGLSKQASVDVQQSRKLIGSEMYQRTVPEEGASRAHRSTIGPKSKKVSSTTKQTPINKQPNVSLQQSRLKQPSTLSKRPIETFSEMYPQHSHFDTRDINSSREEKLGLSSKKAPVKQETKEDASAKKKKHNFNEGHPYYNGGSGNSFGKPEPTPRGKKEPVP